jgi:hypothetical protein
MHPMMKMKPKHPKKWAFLASVRCLFALFFGAMSAIGMFRKLAFASAGV